MASTGLVRKSLAPAARARRLAPSLMSAVTMNVQQDQVGPMLPRQFDAQAALHGADQMDARRTGENALDQPEVVEIVLDVENCGRLRGFLIPWTDDIAGGIFDGLWTVDARQFNAKAASFAEGTRNGQTSAHQFYQALAERQPQARAFDAALLGAEPVERYE